MLKNYIVKQAAEGTSKKSGNKYRMVELHDPTTLENTVYYLRDNQQHIDLKPLSFKQEVLVTHGIETFNGQAKLTIESIQIA